METGTIGGKCLHLKNYPFESLHADIAGPFDSPGADGSRYWVTIVDDFSHWGWIHPIKEKSDFPEVLKSTILTHERPEKRCHLVLLP